MIQLKIVLFGVTLIATVGYAIYSHYTNRPQAQTYGRGGTIPPDGNSGSARPSAGDSSRPPSSTINSTNLNSRRRKRTATNCTICLETIPNNPGNCSTLKCGHDFHTRCINIWLKAKNNCPVCRATE